MKRLITHVVVILLLCGCSKDKSTEPKGNDTPPSVVSTSPVTGAIGVAVGSPVQVTFSQDMDASTLTTSTFTMSNGVTGTVSYSNRIATFSPNVPLANNTTYSVTITIGAKNAEGIALAQSFSWSFTTIAPDSVMDIDGNVYYTVMVGTQVWLAENLQVTHYRNGDPIANITDNTAWLNLDSGAYCNYDNNAGTVATYGRLYNGFIVSDSRGIAPTGWHIPSDDEWLTLERYVGMTINQSIQNGWRGTIEGGSLKEAGWTHWASPNAGATNSSNFTALPTGIRYPNGTFQSVTLFVGFWTTTLSGTDFAYGRTLGYDTAAVYRAGYDKNQGMSIRCIKD